MEYLRRSKYPIKEDVDRYTYGDRKKRNELESISEGKYFKVSIDCDD